MADVYKLQFCASTSCPTPLKPLGLRRYVHRDRPKPKAECCSFACACEELRQHQEDMQKRLRAAAGMIA